MQHMTNSNIQITTTIDFVKMAGSHNNYDVNLVHPHNHKIKFMGLDGAQAELSVAQLATMAAISNAMGSPGQTIDRLFVALKQQLSDAGFTQNAIESQITAICERF